MTVIAPIRSDNAYFGFGKETSPGTAVAPSWFPRWLDGSSFEVDLKAEDFWEGDGTRQISQIIKNRQLVKIKHVCSPRMNEVGMLEEAAMGIASDSFTAGTPSGTLHTAVTGGTSTTLVLTGAGFSAFLTPASGNINLLIVDPTNGNEIVPCTLPDTGTSPYTFTVASSYNGGKVKTNHAGSDVLTVAVLTTVSTSLTSAATKGAATIAVGNNSNMTATSTQTLILSPGLASEEIVTVSTPASSGTGPWTFTLANGATLKNAHSSGDLVESPAIHVLTDQETDGDYYTIEVGLGALYGAAGMAIRVRDCKMTSCKVSGKAGSELMYESEWIGIACAVQVSPATITLEQHPVFLYDQGVWTVDGTSSSNDAISVESFSIERKNAVDDGIQTEQLTLAALIFGNFTVDVGFDTVFSAGSRFFLVYFGGGTADSQTIGAGAFQVAFTQPDGFETITYLITTTHYTKVGGISPKKDGKHYKQSVACAGVSNSGANAAVMTTTITNSQYSSY